MGVARRPNRPLAAMSFGSLGSSVRGFRYFRAISSLEAPHISPPACWRIFHRGERIFKKSLRKPAEQAKAGPAPGSRQLSSPLFPWPSPRLGGADLRSSSPLSFLTKDQPFVRPAGGWSIIFRGRPSSRRQPIVHGKRRGQGTEMLAELTRRAGLAQLVFRSALTAQAAPRATCLLSPLGAHYRFGNRQGRGFIIK
jgi:hypothetical protein